MEEEILMQSSEEWLRIFWEIEWQLGKLGTGTRTQLFAIIIIASSYREWKKLVVTRSPCSLYVYMKQYGMLIKMAKQVAKIISLRATCCLQKLGDLYCLLWGSDLVKLFLPIKNIVFFHNKTQIFTCKSNRTLHASTLQQRCNIIAMLL